MSRFLAVLLLVLAGPLTVHADDLKAILERDKLALQKLQGDVNYALIQAKVFERNSNPARAKQTLDDAMTKVQNAKDLPEAERTKLRQQLQTRLNEVNRLVRAQELADEEAAKRAADKIRRDQPPVTNKAGYDTAKNKIISQQEQIAAAQRLRDQKAKGTLGVLASLDVSSTPINGVVEYPKYWRELTDNRKKIAGNALSEKEIKLLKALNSTLSIDYKNTQFKDVLEDIMEKAGLAILVDEGSLREAMVESNDPVTFKVNKVTVRTILKKVLADRGLAYILVDGNVQVVTAQKARETMVVRAYPIDDLVGGGNQLYGPFVNRAIMLSNVQGLINTIQNAIDPALWNVNGGPGSITFSEASRALIIRAPAEMHYMFGAGGMFR